MAQLPLGEVEACERLLQAARKTGRSQRHWNKHYFGGKTFGKSLLPF
jgi:hypothetical protein